MRVWTVHVRPPAEGVPARATLLRDGFAPIALLAPPLWFLAHGLVAATAAYVALVAVICITLQPAAALALVLGVNLFIGFEARTLQGWWLSLRGWRTEAVVMGRDADAAFLQLAAWRPDLARAAD
ncbi:hypothetical protein GXW78_23455 [Roseomonas terrae]|jgi:hypothetical protein|uniref:DUF2628 domain-containing protein n=1 Tax=Neoroseomonas terrae TaxID=424799 RepID=A0ABS5ENM5_9PROT|nr:DUF2628 domain-containing protein [Neoroseomonas terrae]MBR0652634.1 hypothetical protein [Neoroseomonas terrae]